MNRLRFLETDPVVAGCNSHDEIIPLYVLQADAIGAWRVLHDLFCALNAKREQVRLLRPSPMGTEI